MDTTNKHDWGLVIAGVLLVICSMFFLFAPGLALVTITVIAGAAFLVSGIFDIVNYFRFRRAMDLSGWALAYGALDIVLGILFFGEPAGVGRRAGVVHRRVLHRVRRVRGRRRVQSAQHGRVDVGLDAVLRASSGRCAV